MIEEVEAGWQVRKSEVIGDTHLVTVTMTSVDPNQYTEEIHNKLHENLTSHSHRFSVSTNLFTFDHEPTDEDIEEAVTNIGFSPDLTPSKPSSIKTTTVGESDVLEYSANFHPAEFLELLNMVPISLDENPTSMSLKGDWLHLYYVNEKHTPPSQFFSNSFFLYSVRIHRTTGQIKRKGYNKGLTLGSDVTDTLAGFDSIENIVAEGIYLDEPLVAIYYMKSSDEKDYVESFAVVDTPYYGTTWENGNIIRTREYKRNE
tara:strand:- start:895 stop:1671 length:777 start_codon:yes stop_codon:yes gene_type:complete